MMMAIPHGTAEQAKFKAYAAFSIGDFSSAVRHFSKAISVGPPNYLLYSNRSATYATLGKYSEALANAVKTIQLKPGWPKGYFKLDEAYFGLGHFDKAVAAYTKGLECDPYDKGLKVGLAKAQSTTSEPERKALAQKEKDLGNSACMVKDFDTAIVHYTKAIELSDEDISFLLNWARPYLKMGQVWYGPKLSIWIEPLLISWAHISNL